jgi:hypothetical protein
MTEKLNSGEIMALFGGPEMQTKLKELADRIEEAKLKNVKLEEENRYYKIKTRKVNGEQLTVSDGELLEAYERKLNAREASVESPSKAGDKSYGDVNNKRRNPETKQSNLALDARNGPYNTRSQRYIIVID